MYDLVIIDLGGTVGLFTGLSLISVVEVSFWLFRTVKDQVLLSSGKKSFYDRVQG